MAITRAQQFKQMLAQGGRIGLFRGAEADARAGRGDISPGTDRGGNVRSGDEPKGLRLRGTIDRRPPTITPEPKPRDDMFFGDEPMPMMGPSFKTRVGRGLRSIFDQTLLGRIINRARGAPPGSPDYNVAANFISRPDIDFGGRDEMGNRFLFPMMAQGPRTMDTMPTEEEEETPFRLAPRFRAEGGSMNDEVVGGEMDFESARQMYGLGKLVKKVTRTVKKIAKSPIGKAAITAAAAYYMPKYGIKAKGGLMPFLVGRPESVISPLGQDIFKREATKGLFGIGGKLTTMGALKGIAGLSALAGLTAEEQEDETVSPDQLGPGLNIPEYRRDPFGNLAIRFRAEGGSTEAKEPVAKKTMPLLDMGGMEKDYREDGGFVPIGRMEKADDVPARLSKNEFVFTADAVRNAGDGDVDKGAEVMYNMMKNLEAGGEVSEESQGLKGARKMFQTSQRLEEVL